MGSHTKQQDNDSNTYQSFMKKNIKAIEKALKMNLKIKVY